MSLGPRAALDAGILAAHHAGDGATLARLYALAASAFADAGDDEREAFYLSQAFVFALEAGTPEADQLADRLRSTGRHD